MNVVAASGQLGMSVVGCKWSKYKGVKMHFDPNAWTYDAAHPVRTLQQLPAKLLHTHSVVALAQELPFSGGKALGLCICDRLAQGSSRLRVPPWISVEPSELGWGFASGSSAWLDSRLTPIKVRSSTRNEDWLDGRSGLQASRTVKNPERVWDHASEVSGGVHPVVLQECVEGIGLVVDVAYSRLLEQTVVRISTGREQQTALGHRRFTSATQDSEGCHFVIDPLSGRTLMPRAQGTLITKTLTRLPVRELARELYERLVGLHIEFGVQLEVIIHPETPWTWWLVQIRPSPDRVRSSDVRVQALEFPLLTTPAVSSAFNIRSPATLTDNNSLDWLMLCAGGGKDHAKQECGDFLPSDILVWHRRGDADWNAWMIDAASQAGARVQVTRGVLIVNTSHGSIAPSTAPETGQAPHVSIIAVPNRVHASILRVLKQRSAVLHVVSDGLVGQIALT